MNLNKTSPNRLIFSPGSLLRGFGSNLVVTPTNHYCQYHTAGGMTLPDGGDTHVEKKYDIGEVVAMGPNVNVGINIGDIVIWQCTSAWRLPNGVNEPSHWHLLQSGVVAVLPNPANALAYNLTEELHGLLERFHEKNSGADREAPEAQKSLLGEDALRATRDFIANAYGEP